MLNLFQVTVEHVIICNPNLSGPINRLVYNHERLVAYNDVSITFWCNKTGSDTFHKCQNWSNTESNIDSWEKQKTLNVAELNTSAFGHGGKGIENVIFDSPHSCVIIWNNT